MNPRHPLRSNLSVRDVVLTGLTGTVERPFRWEASAEQVAKADDLIAEVGLTSRTDAGWKVLSQGERGRALVARALIADPAAPPLRLAEEARGRYVLRAPS